MYSTEPRPLRAGSAVIQTLLSSGWGSSGGGLSTTSFSGTVGRAARAGRLKTVVVSDTGVPLERAE
ncbi:hypothetical protein GCM10009716_27170 [Streptomyces sodiiphilus]|uniref:Uncharacterized protein n=1 Tax=Streptomyces sodiiphilus TaxID=226217 RepID=A0ABN2PC04_9ACTN